MAVKAITIHGRAVAVRQLGSGPVILLVHGIAGTMHTWDAVADDLAEHYTVVIPDLPGHGASESSNGDYSLGAYASGLRDLLDALGHTSATVVGHSFGGGVAMQFAYQFPKHCDRLVLVSSGGLGSEVNVALRAATLPGAELVLGIISHQRVIDAAGAVGRLASRIGVTPPRDIVESARSYASLAESEPRKAFVQTVRAVMDRHGQRVSASDRLTIIDHIPSLIVWGTDDRIIPVWHAIRAHEALPGSRLELFEHAGHFPHVSDPARFVDVMESFLAGAGPRAKGLQ